MFVEIRKHRHEFFTFSSGINSFVILVAVRVYITDVNIVLKPYRH